MLAFLIFLLGAIATYFAITIGLHAYRMRTDPDYCSSVFEAEEEQHLQQKVDRLLQQRDES